jgi:phosphatidylinositol glycan class U
MMEFLAVLAISARIVLCTYFPSLVDLVSRRPEVSTPINSYKRLLEGIFLYKSGLDPYDGGVFHQVFVFY